MIDTIKKAKPSRDFIESVKFARGVLWGITFSIPLWAGIIILVMVIA